MYHIKFHFTTVNDDESAKNNQSVSSFPEETHMRKLAQFLAWFLNFVLMGPAYGASENALKKWAVLYLAVLDPAVYIWRSTCNIDIQHSLLMSAFIQDQKI